jgi:cell division protein FtsA
MDNTPEIVVGLDIGTTKIACIVGKKDENGKIEILGVGKSESLGVSRGIVSNIEKTVQSIKAAVEEAEAKSGVEIRVVNVGIAGQHIKSHQHRGMITRENIEEEINKKDIDRLVESMFKLVMLPGEEIIHVLPQDYIVDREQGIKDPIGMAGSHLEANFHIITGQVAAARNIYKCVAKAGLEVAELTLEPLASAAAVLTDDEKEAGVALVDIGGGTTDIAIFKDGIIRHTAVIPFGGNIITDDIKEGCTILQRHAELLKTKFGAAIQSTGQENEIVCIPGLKGREPKEISVKNLSGIIQARMEEIIEHIYYEIKSSGHDKKLIGGIVVTGGGSQLKYIRQLFEYVTGMDTRVGLPTEQLGKNTIENITSPTFATGVGLVIRGLETVENQKLKNTGKERTTSQKTKSNFFDKIVKGFFDENID